MNHENEELNNTKALDDLNNLVNKKSNNNYDNLLNDIESKEDIYNTITSDEVVLNNDVDTNKDSLIDKIKKLPKKTKIIIIIIIILILILIALGIYLVLKKEEPKPPEEPPENIVVDNGNYRYNNGVLEFLDSFNTKIGEYTCTNQDEELCFVAYLSNNEDTFNKELSVNEDNSLIEVRSNIYHNRYVFIKDGENSNIILYDVIENKSVGEYLKIKVYDDSDLIVIENLENKYGVIEITDNEIKEVLPINYEYVGKIKNDDKYIVKTNQGYYITSKDNKNLTKVSKDLIYDYNNNYLVTKNNDKYNLYNYNMDLINTDLDYITLIDNDYYAYVLNNKLYIKDFTNNKYNEEGYELTNDNYQVIKTYNPDGELIKTDYSYRLTRNDNSLGVYIKDNENIEEYTINLLEGIVSKDLKYYSYFNDTLYFYSDLEKNNLLGKYKCTNKNTLENNTLSSCNIAYNEIYDDNFKNNGAGKTTSIIPIIANRYVFINDSVNNEEIKLYDLVEEKTEATYKGVSVNQGNNSEITFIASINNVIVQNRQDKFGTINISSGGVTKNLDFIYDAIERMGDSFLVKENNKYYIRYANERVSNEFSNKIYDYNSSYLVVREADGFAIYKQNDNTNSIVRGKVMVKLLGDTCYSYVENNKLHLSLYDNTPIKHEEIILPDTNDIYSLYNSYTLSKIDDNKVQVNVFKNGSIDKTYTINLTIGNNGDLNEES